MQSEGGYLAGYGLYFGTLRLSAERHLVCRRFCWGAAPFVAVKKDMGEEKRGKCRHVALSRKRHGVAHARKASFFVFGDGGVSEWHGSWLGKPMRMASLFPFKNINEYKKNKIKMKTREWRGLEYAPLWCNHDLLIYCEMSLNDQPRVTTRIWHTWPWSKPNEAIFLE